MHRRHLLFVAALVLVLLMPRNFAFSQDSTSSQETPSTPVGRSVQSDNDEVQPDQDIKLLRKDLRSKRKQVVAARRSVGTNAID